MRRSSSTTDINKANVSLFQVKQDSVTAGPFQLLKHTWIQMLISVHKIHVYFYYQFPNNRPRLQSIHKCKIIHFGVFETWPNWLKNWALNSCDVIRLYNVIWFIFDIIMQCTPYLKPNCLSITSSCFQYFYVKRHLNTPLITSSHNNFIAYVIFHGRIQPKKPV